MMIVLLCVTCLLYCTSTCFGDLPQNKTDGTTVQPFVCRSIRNSVQTRKEENVSPKQKIALRSFLLSLSTHWPRGLVYYEIDTAFSQPQVEMILEALQKFKEVSCVKWLRRQDLTRDYVRFQRVAERGVCSSMVGRLGGRQLISLNDDCFNVNQGYRGAILHEMMHAVGFVHEQQRLDRNCYVRVALEASENKPEDYAITQKTSLDFPYDFRSIMHYGHSNFLNSLEGDMIGNHEGEFTDLDIMKLNFMYCGGRSFCQLQPSHCNEFRQAEQRCSLGD